MDEYISILLLPEHVAVSPANLPLLKPIQTVLNEAYKKTYCARHEIFGDDHVRLADPAQFADLIKGEGFMVVVLQVEPAHADGSPCAAQVVATGSVKNFGIEDVNTYAQWSENIGGAEWKAKREKAGADVAVAEVAPTEDAAAKEKPAIDKFELIAFAVSPHVQAKGLGVKVLREVEWLTSMYRPGTGLQHILDSPDAGVTGVEIGGVASIQGFDIQKLRNRVANMELSSTDKIPQLVLMAIRELGTEVYYEKRGFKTTWTGNVPVGMWACLKSCTMVFMERQ